MTNTNANNQHRHEAAAEALEGGQGRRMHDGGAPRHGLSAGPVEPHEGLPRDGDGAPIRLEDYRTSGRPEGFLTIYDFVADHAPGMLPCLADPGKTLMLDSHDHLTELSEVLRLPVHQVEAPPVAKAHGVETVTAHQAGVFLGLLARWGAPF